MRSRGAETTMHRKPRHAATILAIALAALLLIPVAFGATALVPMSSGSGYEVKPAPQEGAQATYQADNPANNLRAW